jgi:hypothetical protein
VHGAAQQIWINDVRLGSKADIQRPLSDVRFTPESGHGRHQLQHLGDIGRDPSRLVFGE